MIENIKQEVKDIFGWIIEHRRHFHLNPELSFKEYKTSDYILKKLNELDIPVKVLSGTGVVGLIGKGDNCVALRADMDALPISEETGLEFCSRNNGIMHACGHDFHMAMLLGAASVLKKNEDKLDGTVKLIFQPGEEKIPGGASLMIKEGVLKDPKPRYVFGQHINPSVPTGKIASTAGPMMASADELYWEIKGKSCHAAQPHLGNDPILASAQLTLTLQSLLGKFKDPVKPGVLTVTSIHGGEATNITPDSVSMKGTLRFFDDELRFEFLKKIHIICEDIGRSHGVKIMFEPLIGYPPVINDPVAESIVRISAETLFQNENYILQPPIMWGEDFSYYGMEVPSCFWFTGCNGNPGIQMPPLHNSRLCPDENLVLYGTSMLIQSAIEGLNR